MERGQLGPHTASVIPTPPENISQYTQYPSPHTWKNPLCRPTSHREVMPSQELSHISQFSVMFLSNETFFSFPPATAHSILEAHLHSPKNPKQNVEPRTTKHHPLVLEEDAGFEEGPTNTAITSLISTLGSLSRHKDFQEII